MIDNYNATREEFCQPVAVRPRKVTTKHKRRYCRIEGCPRVVKSQGVCQRHGAKPSLCKVKGCAKQAQGNFDGMCKAHFAEMKQTAEDHANAARSVYDTVLPATLCSEEEAIKPPIIDFLRNGYQQPPGWHRIQEREARGYPPITDLTVPLEAWEQDLVCTETLLLTGLSEGAFLYLAKAWGRVPGFHLSLATAVLERYRT